MAQHAWARSRPPRRNGYSVGVSDKLFRTLRKQTEETLGESETELRGLNEALEERVQRAAELTQTTTRLHAEICERTAAEERIKTLFKRLVSLQEEERRRVARDIHDHLGQQMTALRMHLDVLSGRVESALTGDVERIRRLAENLDHSIDFLTREL